MILAFAPGRKANVTWPSTPLALMGVCFLEGILLGIGLGESQ